MNYKLRQYQAYGKKCEGTYKMNHFKEVCRSSKSSMVHKIETEADQEQETDIEMVNIISIKFNFNVSAILAYLKTSSNKS